MINASRLRAAGVLSGVALFLLAAASAVPHAPSPAVARVRLGPASYDAPYSVAAQPGPRPSDPGLLLTAPRGLTEELRSISSSFPGRVGIAVTRIDGDWTVGARMGELFPQQSVSKLWVSLAILDKIDAGELTLNQPITITAEDLSVFNQPIRARVLKEGQVQESVLSLMEQALTHSDNTANDSLLRTAGGPSAVRAFLISKRIANIRFGPGERLLQAETAGLSWRQNLAFGNAFKQARNALPMSARREALNRYLADPLDGAAPDAISRTLARLARGELLSPSSTQLMLSILERTHSGPQRLKAGVPDGWTVLHKTGTGQDLPPVSTGYNDVGILVAPDGTRYAVAVMIGETTAGVPARMKMMQAVSGAVARWHRL